MLYVSNMYFFSSTEQLFNLKVSNTFTFIRYIYIGHITWTISSTSLGQRLFFIEQYKPLTLLSGVMHGEIKDPKQGVNV